jgi:hypothetical protein
MISRTTRPLRHRVTVYTTLALKNPEFCPQNLFTCFMSFSEKERLFSATALSGWCLQWRCNAFSVEYAPSFKYCLDELHSNHSP